MRAPAGTNKVNCESKETLFPQFFPNPAGPPYEPISQPDALFTRHLGQILCLGNLGMNSLLHLLQALYPATIAQFLHSPFVPLTFLLIRHLEQTTFLVIYCFSIFCRFNRFMLAILNLFHSKTTNLWKISAFPALKNAILQSDTS